MKRIQLTILAGAATLAFLPSGALARGHGHHAEHHRGSHAGRAHRTRRSENGSGNNPSNTSNVGTVTAISGTAVTVTLNNGFTETGNVTSNTHMECTAAKPQMQRDDGGPGNGDQGGGGRQGGDNGSNQGDNGRGDGDGQNDGDQGGDNNAQMCTPAVGMTVTRAELRIDGVGAMWDELRLIS